jgi:hypothetical protein
MLINNKEFGLSQPFVESYREGDMIHLVSNIPNDTIGDFAFEWDFDGSERRKWQAHIEDLRAKGTLGDLQLITLSARYNPVLDTPNKVPWRGGLMIPGEKFSEPVFMIFDVSDNKKPGD